VLPRDANRSAYKKSDTNRRALYFSIFITPYPSVTRLHNK
jgi:hypothetical protein